MKYSNFLFPRDLAMPINPMLWTHIHCDPLTHKLGKVSQTNALSKLLFFFLLSYVGVGVLFFLVFK